MSRRLGVTLLPLLLTVLAVVVAGLAPTTAEAGRPARAVAAAPTIEWGPCPYHDPPVECALVAVPLDHDDPDGPTTRIAVTRSPAKGVKIGTLFVNPGGPGGSATDFAPFAARLIGPGVARRFDVVGIDPRGVGFSRPAWCRVPPEAYGSFAPFPVSDRAVRARLRADRALNNACAERRSAVVDHASTADVARDMDLVREALGEEQITYYGISYGSLLGQTYAAMFPDRIRAMIVDGVLDAVEWTRGNDTDLPMTYRLRSGRGAYEAITSAFNECDRVGRAQCPIAGHANESWRQVVRRARAGDLRVGRSRVSYQELVGNALGSLYDVRSLRYLVQFLAAAERDVAAVGRRSDAAARAWAELERLRARRDEIGPFGFDYRSAVGAPARTERASSAPLVRIDLPFESVICSDAVNPTDPQAWVTAGRQADRHQPWFGRLWTWASSVCAGWQGQGGDDAYRGPWATTTSYPLLVVSTAHDPATPINGARTATRYFEDSVLLLLNSWGHGALASGDCIETRMAAYLIDRTLPEPGTVCRSDARPFPDR